MAHNEAGSRRTGTGLALHPNAENLATKAICRSEVQVKGVHNNKVYTSFGLA